MATTSSTVDRIFTPLVRDILLPVGLIAVDWASLAARSSFMGGGPGPKPPTIDPEPHPPTTAAPIAYALVAAAFLPLVLRRKFPLTVLAITTVMAAMYQFLNLQPSLIFLAPLIALYTVGTLQERRMLLIAGTLAAALTLAVSLPAWGNTSFWTETLRIVSMFGVAAALGDATRNRRAYVAEVERRAVDAEQSREEEASRRVDEERLRIARELHDVTAHSLSIIAVQSGAAAHVMDSDPTAAREALEAIRRTSKDALDELRAMLGVLRAPGDAEAPLAPVPGLARLGDLVTPLTAAGYVVTSDVETDLGDVPAVVELSAYRIIQESLTNVVRHAGVCSVRLVLRREDDALVIAVDDDGHSEQLADVGRGHGINGMRERVTALGGTFEATALLGGGFHVGARLPLGARSGSWQK